MEDFNQLAHQCASSVETAVLVTDTIDQALASLRRKSIPQKIIYIYVIDEQNKLKGVVSTRQLLLGHPNQKIEEIMTRDVVKIYANEPIKKALSVFSENPLLALPVVNQEESLIGIIDVQMITKENINLANPQSRADVFQLIGFTLEDGRKVPLLRSYKIRMPWLLCNVVSGVVCAVISRFYEDVLSRYLVLAFFIPLVLTLSESCSMQSMAQSLQFLRRPRFSWKSAMTRAKQEWEIIGLLAISCALLVGILSLLWEGGFLASLTIGIGILGSVAISAFFGLAVPLFLNRFRLDPKVASGPVVLMIADMLTTALYLSLATWWLL